MKLHTRKYLGLACLGVIALSACNGSTNDNPAPAVGAAYINVINCIPANGSVNYYIDGTRQNIYRLLYFESTGYITVNAGQHNGSVKDSTYSVIQSGSLYLSKGIQYTMLVCGWPSTIPVANIMLTDTALADAVNVKPKVRFANAAPGSPAVDLVLNSTTFSNVAYKSVSKFLRADTGTVAVKIKLAGTNSIILSGTLKLKASSVYTLFTYGLVATTGSKGFGIATIINE